MLAILFWLSIGHAGLVGEDGLLSFQDLSRFRIEELARVPATQLDGRLLEPVREGVSRYPAGRLNGFCPSDRRAGQRVLGGCSGFLIAPDILVTAGHCRRYARGCGDDTWLFGFFSNEGTGGHFELPHEDLRRCREVLDYRHDGGVDYAVLRLDRPLERVRPFEIQDAEDISIGDTLALMGYPLGLPFMYAPGGLVQEVTTEHLLLGNQDVFSNNSGSVVFSLRTGQAVGILTNGTGGTAVQPLNGCQEIRRASEAKTVVNRLTQIPYLRAKFPFSPRRHERVIENRCREPARVVVKFASDKDGAWSTEARELKPEEKWVFPLRPGAIWVNARSLVGRPILRGRDFYGFEDMGREPELGFKRIDQSHVSLCQEKSL